MLIQKTPQWKSSSGTPEQEFGIISKATTLNSSEMQMYNNHATLYIFKKNFKTFMSKIIFYTLTL